MVHWQSGKIMRVLITLLGVAFILHALTSLALGVIGERETGVITHIRRELGQRNEAIPNKYTYIISYSFITSNGQVVTDSVRHIGDAVYVKASGKQPVVVRYIKEFPVCNTLEQDTRLSWGKAVLLGAGLFLIGVMNKTQKQKR